MYRLYLYVQTDSGVGLLVHVHVHDCRNDHIGRAKSLKKSSSIPSVYFSWNHVVEFCFP